MVLFSVGSGSIWCTGYISFICYGSVGSLTLIPGCSCAGIIYFKKK
jgi:hypothetical protein